MTKILRSRLKSWFGSLDAGQRLRMAHLQKVFQPPHNGLVLDAGCNRGDYLLYFARRYPEVEFFGVDINPEAVAQVMRGCQAMGLKNVQAVTHDLTKPIPWKPDLIYCIDVLEHIEQDGLALANLHAALRQGGQAIFHIPLWPQKRFFTSVVHQEDHVREGYRLPDFFDRLHKCGFEVTTVRFTFGNAGLLAWEIQHSMKKMLPLFLARFFSLPTCVLCTALDVSLANKSGNGALVVAAKAQKEPRAA